MDEVRAREAAARLFIGRRTVEWHLFPANFLGEPDFSVLESLDQFAAVIGRDFEAKAPTGTDILARDGERKVTAIKPTVAEFLAQHGALTFVTPDHDPDYPVFTFEQILDAHEDVPELAGPGAGGVPDPAEARGPRGRARRVRLRQRRRDLRQDRQRPHRADDLRRRGGGHGHRPGPGRRPGRRGGRADLRQLYFNVDRMGNVSAASIPIALFDAVRDGVITRRTRVFAPGFGAGAVGGYAVLQVDPAIVADEVVLDVTPQAATPRPAAGGTSDDMRAAFGG